jgi:NADP-dependent 3-hydroxy acid dehydrogenase YdfG
VITLTATVNQAEFRHGVRACSLTPGEVATPIMQKRVPPPPQEVLDRMLQAEDVARAIRFIVETPPHTCIQEIVLAPTWNRALA